MTNRNSILFVEDSDLDFELATMAVRQVRPTAVVSRARQCQELPPCPCKLSQLIVLDIHLPDGSGLDLIPKLVNECSGIDYELVVFSTSSNPADRQLAIARGASGYHVKPMEPDKFVEAVRVMVNQHLPAL